MKTPAPPTSHSRQGFTLVELLVVIGVMAVVATIIGVGLSRGGDGASLTAAQNMVMSQFAATRAQAALRGENAALVVVDDATAPASSRRVLGVAVEDEGGWHLIADSVRLPGTVGVVELEADTSLWQETLAVVLEVGEATTNCRAIEIAPNGSLDVAGGGELWLSLGQPSATGWQPLSDAPRRSIRVSRYGAMQPIEDETVSE